MKRLLLAFLLIFPTFGCSKEDKTKVKYDSKMRSTGTSLQLSRFSASDALELTNGNSVFANSAVTLEYLKIPIRRISLTAGYGPGGYTEASPNFYSCSGTEIECGVNLLDSSLDNLLAGSSSGDFELQDEKTYTGVAVEHCDNGIGSTYQILLKGSVTVGSTIYYTNTTDGLSSTGPAEETAINVGCQGSNSALIEPVTVKPDSNISIVFYTDPSANVFASVGTSNSNCTGTGTKICANNIMVFGTVDSAKPTVERYRLDTGSVYADVLVSLLFNQADQPFGALISEVYGNEAKDQLLHSPTFSLNRLNKTTDGGYDLAYGSGESETIVVANFKRSNHEGTIDQLVTEKTAYTAIKY